MGRRASAAALSALLEVERIRMLGAEEALAAAREGRKRADAEVAAGAAALVAAERSWRECLDRPGFAPELTRLLVGELLRRDTASVAAAEQARAATAHHERRQDAWRLANARSRAVEDARDDARRGERRRRDERALLATTDRISQTWRPRR